MKELKAIRSKNSLSQRRFAAKASIAYKTVQLMESGDHDLKISTLEKIATNALGFPASGIERVIGGYLNNGRDSVLNTSFRIIEDGESSWKVWLFEFVDSFRREKDDCMIANPPARELPPRLCCLLASTVEVLCKELKMECPAWVFTAGKLDAPWFVSGFESLKCSALIESPADFRKRNVFVLKNFLERA